MSTMAAVSTAKYSCTTTLRRPRIEGQGWSMAPVTAGDSFANDRKIPQHRVIGHPLQWTGGGQSRTVLLDSGNRGEDVRDSLTVSPHSGTTSRSAAVDTRPFNNGMVTTSTFIPRMVANSSMIPATCSQWLACGSVIETMMSRSESSRASPRATDPKRRGSDAPYRARTASSSGRWCSIRPLTLRVAGLGFMRSFYVLPPLKGPVPVDTD